MKRFPNLKKYFENKKYDGNNWRDYPIILRWAQTDRMEKSLAVIDRKVGYLLPIAKRKVEEWFSSDNNLTQITAERYILDYLRTLNPDFQENFKGNGVDAFLLKNGNKIGLEVTTVNEMLPEWLFQERLLMYLNTQNYSVKGCVEISYNNVALTPISYTYDLIEDIGNAIISGNFGTIKGFVLKKRDSKHGYISWNLINNNFDLLNYLDVRLNSIITAKAKQLSKNAENILFIGVDQLPITNYMNSELFKEISAPKKFISEIQALQDIVSKTLPQYVVGVCFFVYHLEHESPFYPLKILWRNNKNVIPIKI